MQFQSDEQLMARVMEGDREALARLVERYHSPLIAYLYRLLEGDHALAEDLTQETFIRVIQQRSYHAGSPFKPWLYAIATNLARDHFKSAATRHAASDDHDFTAQPDGASGPEQSVLAAEAHNEVAAALAQLGPEYRATLLLRFFAGLSLAEIAASLDVPVGTVKSRLSVGCHRLRDLLAGDDRKA
ncbi:MAG TPA: sigma-70 family RNA polymerase sigma factor [Chloroflexia bacterium]|nr:sigma-70 family RNA polymerase sigma factor [Chloroflexia bacterium]